MAANRIDSNINISSAASAGERNRSAAETQVVETSWWLDWSALPESLLWARLQVAEDGAAVVLDLDGMYHRFPDRRAAVLWLNEDEYSPLTHLAENGEVGLDVIPPMAASDRDLVPLMRVKRKDAEQAAPPDRDGE